MASKNSVKIYRENTYYHIYNRGVEKRNIFLDVQDYSVFLSYLKTYLIPKDESALKQIATSQASSINEKDRAIKELHLKNYSNSIDLLCYALLPNHFHLLIKQKTIAMKNFINSLGTRYVMYFNRKYKRSGVLFQDTYKAVEISSDEQLLHVSRYIHLNPIKYARISIKEWDRIGLHFSLPEYIGKRDTEWIRSSYILDYFSKTNPAHSYRSFLELPVEPEIMTQAAIDNDDE